MRTETTATGPHYEEMGTPRSRSLTTRSPTSRSTTPPLCGDASGKFSVLDELRSDSLWPDYERSHILSGNTNVAGEREISIADLKIDLFIKRFYERERQLGISTDDNNNQILPPIVLDFVLHYSITSTFTPSFPNDRTTTSKTPSVVSEGGALQQLQQFSAASTHGDDLQQLFASTSSCGNQSASPLASAASPQPVQQLQQLQPPDSPRPASTSPDYLVPLRRPPPTAGYRAKKERYRPPVQKLRQPSFLQHAAAAAAAARKEAFKYRGTYSQRKDQSDPPQLQDPRLAQNYQSQSILKFPQKHDPRRVLPSFCLPLQPCPHESFQSTPRGRPRMRLPKTVMPGPLVHRNRKRPQKKSMSDTWNRKVKRTMDAIPQSAERREEMHDCMIIGEIRKTSSRC
ncbi:hypothetical protein PRIPAC_83366 [Pristionchus pacificus]|uniref:Uncharacterized protein n=1 Tax=Pristionchus pacificus TaxID=54126 RepID=A0A2A6BUJ8_PRIPA|nr:hypothetical protein PRIPAC_83366 [Pristionchus pacificus]|eukprot:PDM69483.1 hypothetical protein PRIPAC_44579 [Pristionchus pacificus]